jgi:hypothetical protein
MVAPCIFQAMREIFNRLNAPPSQHQPPRSRRAHCSNQPDHLFHKSPFFPPTNNRPASACQVGIPNMHGWMPILEHPSRGHDWRGPVHYLAWIKFDSAARWDTEPAIQRRRCTKRWTRPAQPGQARLRNRSRQECRRRQRRGRCHLRQPRRQHGEAPVKPGSWGAPYGLPSRGSRACSGCR